MAVADEASANLGSNTKQMIQLLGPRKFDLGEREPWAYIGIKGKEDYYFSMGNTRGEHSFAFVKNYH